MADYRFIKVHNGFPEHRKTVGLSDRAFRNLIELWCYCSRNLNDGKVPKVFGSRVVTARTKRELIDAGFMSESDTEFEMLDYLGHQMSAQQVSDLHRKRADAGRMGGSAKASAKASATPSATDVLVAKAKVDRDVDRDVEENVDAAASDLPREDVQHICTYLADRIEGNGSRRPEIGKGWRTEARLLIDKDGRTVEQIVKAIDFSQEDPFWRINIMSMPKLREKYDQLRLSAIERDNKAKAQTTNQRGPRIINGAPGQMRMEL